MLYREGMSGAFLFSGICAIVYFIVGIRFADVPLWEMPVSMGEFVVLFLIQLCAAGMLGTYIRKKSLMYWIGGIILGVTGVAVLFSLYVIPFDVAWIQLGLCILLILYLIYMWLRERINNFAYIAMFILGSVVFFYSSNYVFSEVLSEHQKPRIEVVLGMKEDLTGAGYNVNQSKIAIGSGGLTGKGFLNGTQTKLKYVPEQDTDFIFCTIGEEQGFLGASAVLLLFLAFILRIMALAERQPDAFGRVYGYSLVGIFLFHLFINVGMVLGITPVIGIPLPFFSYGGSSLWGFTILLFIFIRIDSARKRV
jgi:rod shape determining protein RodA